MLLEYKVVFPLGQYKSETLAIQNMFTITFFVKTIKNPKSFLLLSKLLEVVLEVKAYILLLGLISFYNFKNKVENDTKFLIIESLTTFK